MRRYTCILCACFVPGCFVYLAPFRVRLRSCFCLLFYFNMEVQMKKRSRTENYSQEETFVLLECVSKYKHIVENKKTDAVTWKEKDEAWERISDMYNSTSTNGRTSKQLRSKYESLKKDTRKSVAAERQSRLQTGGGPSVVKPNPILDKVREMIQFSTEGLPSIFDSDSMPEVVTEVIVGTDTDCGSASCVPHHAEAQCSSATLEVELDVPVISPEHLQNYKPPSPVERNFDHSYTGSTGAEDVVCTPSTLVSTQYSEHDTDWSNYSPKMLRKRKSKPLRNALNMVNNSSPTVSGQQSMRSPSVSAQRLGSWATEKKCLATLQQELLKKQFLQREKREQELHAIEMQIKKKELQIKKEQLNILRMDLQIKRKTLHNNSPAH